MTAVRMGLLLIVMSVVLASRMAVAQQSEPNWSSFTEVTAGASFLRSSQLHKAQPGFVAGAAQGIRYRKFLFSLGFGATYFIINEPGPPYAQSLRILDVTPSLGYLTPVGPLSVSLEAFYKLRQFRSNGLVGITGDDPLQHGVGVASTIRYPATRNIFVAVRPFYGITPTTREKLHEFGAALVIGFSATID